MAEKKKNSTKVVKKEDKKDKKDTKNVKKSTKNSKTLTTDKGKALLTNKKKPYTPV